MGLSSSTANVDKPWAVLVGTFGRVVRDSEGRPQVIEPASGVKRSLEPINAQWLTPDAKNPARRRILFQTQEDEENGKRRLMLQ